MLARPYRARGNAARTPYVEPKLYLGSFDRLLGAALSDLSLMPLATAKRYPRVLLRPLYLLVMFLPLLVLLQGLLQGHQVHRAGTTLGFRPTLGCTTLSCHTILYHTTLYCIVLYCIALYNFLK